MNERVVFTTNPNIDRLSFMMNDVSSEVISSAYPTGTETTDDKFSGDISRRKALVFAGSALLGSVLGLKMSRLNQQEQSVLKHLNEQAKKDVLKPLPINPQFNNYHEIVKSYVNTSTESGFWHKFEDNLRKNDQDIAGYFNVYQQGGVNSISFNYYENGIRKDKLPDFGLSIESHDESTNMQFTFNLDAIIGENDRSHGEETESSRVEKAKALVDFPWLRELNWDDPEGMDKKAIDPKTGNVYKQSIDPEAGIMYFYITLPSGAEGNPVIEPPVGLEKDPVKPTI